MIQQVWETQPQAVSAKTPIKQLTQPRNRTTALLQHGYNFTAVLIVFVQQKRKSEIAGCFGEIFMLIFSHTYSLFLFPHKSPYYKCYLPPSTWLIPWPIIFGHFVIQRPKNGKARNLVLSAKIPEGELLSLC